MNHPVYRHDDANEHLVYEVNENGDVVLSVKSTAGQYVFQKVISRATWFEGAAAVENFKQPGVEEDEVPFGLKSESDEQSAETLGDLSAVSDQSSQGEAGPETEGPVAGDSPASDTEEPSTDSSGSADGLSTASETVE